jgi:hypothetical protein
MRRYLASERQVEERGNFPKEEAAGERLAASLQCAIRKALISLGPSAHKAIANDGISCIIDHAHVKELLGEGHD